jgi:D-serine deaminase-like pyridoxal phosphate-dependent protein
MLDFNWILAAAVSSSLLGLCFLLLCLRQQKQLENLKGRFQDAEQQLSVLSDSGIGVGRKVMAMDKRLQLAERRQQEIESVDPQRISYNEAMKLLSLGAEINDLVVNCGLSKAEAELMSALYTGQPSRR